MKSCSIGDLNGKINYQLVSLPHSPISRLEFARMTVTITRS